MKYLFTLLTVFIITTGSAKADYTMVVPDKPGSGIAVWTNIVVTELNKYLDEKIVIRHIPGGGTISGVNEWHDELRQDNKTLVVTGGANNIHYLINNQTRYDYSYDVIGLQSLNIIAGRIKGAERIIFPSKGSHTPEAMAYTMLEAGPGLTVDEYIEFFKNKTTWVKGMSQKEFRLSFRRGEITGTRENPAAFKKHVQPVIDEGKAELWFHHGVLNPATGVQEDDVNYPGFLFADLFEKRWGVKPSGDFYDAYRLVTSYRDGVNKAIWINSGSSHTEKLLEAMRQVATNPDSVKAVKKKVGNYGWIIGADGNKQRDLLSNMITPKAYNTLVKFVDGALGLAADSKQEFLK